jgi:hypothetical protein
MAIATDDYVVMQYDAERAARRSIYRRACFAASSTIIKSNEAP